MIKGDWVKIVCDDYEQYGVPKGTEGVIVGINGSSGPIEVNVGFDHKGTDSPIIYIGRDYHLKMIRGGCW